MPPRPPSFFLSVCVCVKNERPYLAEFIRHYLAQGADHVYVVDNGSTDAPEALPECADAATVTVLRDARDLRILADDSGPAGHSRLLTETLFVRLRNETEWAVIVDADEFMFGKNGHTLRSYAQTLPADVNRVYVFWNILSPPPAADLAAVPETFSLGQNRRRVNYDRFDDDGLSEDARFAHRFGKSLFRPRHTCVDRGLWLHKVFVHGRAVTNYGDLQVAADDDALPHIDNRPLVAHSEAAYRRLDVTLHHYALRNRADCAKKAAQLTTMPGKGAFVRGLFDLLLVRGNDDDDDSSSSSSSSPGGVFVVDDALPAWPRPPLLRWPSGSSPPAYQTLARSVVGRLDVLRAEEHVADAGVGGGAAAHWVRLVGWALGTTGAHRRRCVRFVEDAPDAAPQPLAAVRRDDVARLYGEPALARCGWNQRVRCRVDVAGGGGLVSGWLELQEAADDATADGGWTRFMRVAFQ